MKAMNARRIVTGLTILMVGTALVSSAIAQGALKVIRHGSPVPGANRCNQPPMSADCTGGQSAYPSEPFPQSTSVATLYTDVFSTKQAGKVDQHLLVNNTLKSIQFCDHVYKTRQILIDKVDVIEKIAGTITKKVNREAKYLTPTSTSKPSIWLSACYSLPQNLSSTNGVLETSDVMTYVAGDPRLPGNTYRLYIAGNGYDVNPSVRAIYLVGGYDGELTFLGNL